MDFVVMLRETSVVFAAVIGMRFLGEDGGRRRLVSAAVAVLLGVIAAAIRRISRVWHQRGGN